MADWYYVDGNGQTVGPVSEKLLSNKYCEGAINDESYVWNGTTVDQWLAISAVPGLASKLKPKPKQKPQKPKPAARKTGTGAARKSPFGGGGGGGGGGRANLLASIQQGTKLKKTETIERGLKPGGGRSGGGGGGGGSSKRGGGPMNIQEQMRMALKNRNQGKKKVHPTEENDTAEEDFWQ